MNIDPAVVEHVAHLEGLAAEVTRTKEDLDEAKAVHREALADVDRTSGRVNSLKEEFDRIETAFDGSKGVLKERQSELTAAKRRLGRAEGALEKAEAKDSSADKAKLEELRAKVEEASGEAAAAQKKVDAAVKETERLGSRHDEIVERLDRARTAAREAEERAKETLEAVESARAARARAAMDAWDEYLEADLIRAPSEETAVKRPLRDYILDRRPAHGDLKTLLIRTPSRTIDPLARKALEVFDKKRKTAEPRVRSRILKEGLASEVLRVTRRLNRRHMTEARRRVLAASYAETLDQLFEEAGSATVVEVRDDVSRWPVATDPLGKAVEDDQGFADAVMLYQERQPDPDGNGDEGPLYAFAKEVVNLTVANAKLDLGPAEKAWLVSEVRSKL